MAFLLTALGFTAEEWQREDDMDEQRRSQDGQGLWDGKTYSGIFDPHDRSDHMPDTTSEASYDNWREMEVIRRHSGARGYAGSEASSYQASFRSGAPVGGAGVPPRRVSREGANGAWTAHGGPEADAYRRPPASSAPPPPSFPGRQAAARHSADVLSAAGAAPNTQPSAASPAWGAQRTRPTELPRQQAREHANVSSERERDSALSEKNQPRRRWDDANPEVQLVKKNRLAKMLKTQDNLDTAEGILDDLEVSNDGDEDDEPSDGMLLLQGCLGSFRCNVKVPPVFSLNDPRIDAWQMFLLLNIVIVSLLVPFDIAFLVPSLDTPEDICLFVFNRCLDLIFTVDLVLQFNLANIDQYGNKITNRQLIAWAYIKGCFFFDLVSIIPFEVLTIQGYAGNNVKAMKGVRLLRLTKLLRIVRGNRVIARLEANYNIDYCNLQLLAFVVMICLLAHWLCCGWYLVIILEENTECINTEWELSFRDCCYNWMDCFYPVVDFTRRSPPRKYLMSMTWAAGELLTVGSEILPVTDVERIFSMFAQVMSGILYAYLIGTVCSIFALKTKLQTEFYEEMDNLNDFLSSTRVTISDPELCVRLRTFMQYSSVRQNALPNIMRKVSLGLQGQLALTVHKEWLSKVNIFVGITLPSRFYVAVAKCLTTHLFAPLEVVIDQEDPLDKIFILQAGIILTRCGWTFAGETFGDECFECFRSNMTRGYVATCLTHGCVYVVDMEELLKIMRRDQFRDACQPIFLKITRRKACAIVNTFKNVVNDLVNNAGDSLYDWVLSARKQLHWLSEEHMARMLPIVVANYQRYNPRPWLRLAKLLQAQKPNAKLSVETILLHTLAAMDPKTGAYNPHTMTSVDEELFRIASMVGAFLNTHKDDACINMLQDMLEPFDLQEHAQNLVKRHRLDPHLIMEVKAHQLYAMGIPMVKAQHFTRWCQGELSSAAGVARREACQQRIARMQQMQTAAERQSTFRLIPDQTESPGSSGHGPGGPDAVENVTQLQSLERKRDAWLSLLLANEAALANCGIRQEQFLLLVDQITHYSRSTAYGITPPPPLSSDSQRFLRRSQSPNIARPGVSSAYLEARYHDAMSPPPPYPATPNSPLHHPSVPESPASMLQVARERSRGQPLMSPIFSIDSLEDPQEDPYYRRGADPVEPRCAPQAPSVSLEPPPSSVEGLRSYSYSRTTTHSDQGSPARSTFDKHLPNHWTSPPPSVGYAYGNGYGSEQEDECSSRL